jgi:hypothetical protein
MDDVYERVYQFEGFVLDMTRRSLCAAELDVELRPKSFDVLCCLVERAGRVVTKDTLFQAVWPGVSVTDESIVARQPQPGIGMRPTHAIAVGHRRDRGARLQRLRRSAAYPPPASDAVARPSR